MTAERETPVRVLLERHLIDLQLQNAPEQYLISRVLARLIELENHIYAQDTAVSDDKVEAEYWKMVAQELAEWLVEGRQIRASMPVSELLDKAQSSMMQKVAENE